MPAISSGLNDVFLKKIKSDSTQKRFADGGGLLPYAKNDDMLPFRRHIGPILGYLPASFLLKFQQL